MPVLVTVQRPVQRVAVRQRRTRPGVGRGVVVNGPDEVLSVRSGRMSLACGSEEFASITTGPAVEVADPQGWYNPQTPTEAGCCSSNVGAITWPPGGQRSGTGETPRAAVDDLLRNLAGIQVVRRAEVLPYGNVDADYRVAVLYEWGRPTILAGVHRSGDTWAAVEEGTCEPKD
jgi:hypothetical protein